MGTTRKDKILIKIKSISGHLDWIEQHNTDILNIVSWFNDRYNGRYDDHVAALTGLLEMNEILRQAWERYYKEYT
jgi:hypothetical protein